MLISSIDKPLAAVNAMKDLTLLRTMPANPLAQDPRLMRISGRKALKNLVDSDR